MPGIERLLVRKSMLRFGTGKDENNGQIGYEMNKLGNGVKEKSMNNDGDLKMPPIVDNDREVNQIIQLRINSRKFDELKEDILNPANKELYFNTEKLRNIVISSIKQDNFKFALEIFNKMIENEVKPDDITYTNLIEELIIAKQDQDAISLYIHAYLSKVTLDLEIFLSLIERLKKKNKTYLKMAYGIFKDTLQPSRMILEILIQIANKKKDKALLEELYKDAIAYKYDDIQLTSVNSNSKGDKLHKRREKFRNNNQYNEQTNESSDFFPNDDFDGLNIVGNTKKMSNSNNNPINHREIQNIMKQLPNFFMNKRQSNKGNGYMQPIPVFIATPPPNPQERYGNKYGGNDRYNGANFMPGYLSYDPGMQYFSPIGSMSPGENFMYSDNDSDSEYKALDDDSLSDQTDDEEGGDHDDSELETSDNDDEEDDNSNNRGRGRGRGGGRNRRR